MEIPIWLVLIIMPTQRHNITISCLLTVCLQMDLPLRLELLIMFQVTFSYHYNANITMTFGFAKWLLTIFSGVLRNSTPALSVRPFVHPTVTLYFFGLYGVFGHAASTQMLH